MRSRLSAKRERSFTVPTNRQVNKAWPPVRDLEGKELVLPSWQHATEEDWLGKWAMNLMLINVSTRKFRRAVRLPEGDVPAQRGRACRSRPHRGTSWRCRPRA